MKKEMKVATLWSMIVKIVTGKRGFIDNREKSHGGADKYMWGLNINIIVIIIFIFHLLYLKIRGRKKKGPISWVLVFDGETDPCNPPTPM